MQNKHQTFFSFFGGPTYGEGGGARWLGQKPKFFRKSILMAPLNDKYNLHYSKDTYRTQTLIKIKHIVTAIRTSLMGKSMLFKA